MTVNLDIEQLRSLSSKYREDTKRPGGVVLIWDSEVYGWKDKLRNADHERPGAIAIDAGGHVFEAQGGDDQNGDNHWVAI